MTLKTFYYLDNEVQNIEFKSGYCQDFSYRHEFSIPEFGACSVVARRYAEAPTTQFEIRTDRSFTELEELKDQQHKAYLAHFLEQFQALSNRFESVSTTVDYRGSLHGSDDFGDGYVEVCEASNEALELPAYYPECSANVMSPAVDSANMYDLCAAETRCLHRHLRMSDFTERLASGAIFFDCELCGRTYCASAHE